MSIQEIALIAHDRKKEEMVAFVQKHRHFFAQFTKRTGFKAPSFRTAFISLIL